MKLRITIYGNEGRSSTRDLEDYMKIAIKQNELDLTSPNLHIKTLLAIVKKHSQEAVDMIDNSDPYIALALDSATSSADFYAKMFKDFTTGMYDDSVVLKRVVADGQISTTIGVFRSKEAFEDMLKTTLESGYDIEFYDITLKEIQELVDK